MIPDDVEAHARLDARFKNGPTRWLGLSTTVPRLEGGVYVNFTEPTAPSYARVQVPASAWPAAANRAVEVDVAWPDTSDDLGDIVAWGLFDTATGGSPRWPGKPRETAYLGAGTTNITVTVRLED